LVVTVTVIFFPASAHTGVYVNEKGDTDDEVGLTVPPPFSVIVTLVALPPKVFPVSTAGVTPHVDPVAAVSVTVGHCPLMFHVVRDRNNINTAAFDI
jgi:hypothetical protein